MTGRRGNRQAAPRHPGQREALEDMADFEKGFKLMASGEAIKVILNVE